MRKIPPPIKEFLEKNREVIDSIYGEGKTDFYLENGIRGFRELQAIRSDIEESKTKPETQ